MAAPRNRCRQCGQQRDAGIPISKRGLCPNCAAKNVQSNLRATLLKEGPLYDKWQKNWEEGMQGGFGLSNAPTPRHSGPQR